MAAASLPQGVVLGCGKRARCKQVERGSEGTGGAGFGRQRIALQQNWPRGAAPPDRRPTPPHAQGAAAGRWARAGDRRGPPARRRGGGGGLGRGSGAGALPEVAGGPWCAGGGARWPLRASHASRSPPRACLDRLPPSHPTLSSIRSGGSVSSVIPHRQTDPRHRCSYHHFLHHLHFLLLFLHYQHVKPTSNLVLVPIP